MKTILCRPINFFSRNFLWIYLLFSCSLLVNTKTFFLHLSFLKKDKCTHLPFFLLKKKCIHTMKWTPFSSGFFLPACRQWSGHIFLCIESSHGDKAVKLGRGKAPTWPWGWKKENRWWKNSFFSKDDNFQKKCYNKKKKRGYGGMVDATDLDFYKTFLSFSKEI